MMTYSVHFPALKLHWLHWSKTQMCQFSISTKNNRMHLRSLCGSGDHERKPPNSTNWHNLILAYQMIHAHTFNNLWINVKQIFVHTGRIYFYQMCVFEVNKVFKDTTYSRHCGFHLFVLSDTLGPGWIWFLCRLQKQLWARKDLLTPTPSVDPFCVLTTTLCSTALRIHLSDWQVMSQSLHKWLWHPGNQDQRDAINLT